MVLVMVTSLLDVLPVIPGRKEAAFAPSGPLTGGTLHCCTAMRLQLVGVCNVVIVILRLLRLAFLLWRAPAQVR